MKSGSCSAASCPSGYSTSVSCSNGTKEESSSYYSGGSVCKRCVNCGSGEQCACPAGQMADGSGGCKAGCAYTSNAACVSSTSDCTSCTKDGDGCYSCSSCANGYDLKNGSCSATACPSGYSTSVSCSNGTKAADSSYYSGISVCKYCTNCGAGETCACSNGKVADGNGNCKCPDGKPNWDGSQCRACTQDSHCDSTQKCDKSSYTCVAVTCANTTCYTVQNHACVQKSGCCTSNSDCTNGQVCQNNKCVTETCPDGYSIYTTSCSNGSKLETSGSIGGKSCGKCVLKTCAEMGYPKSCPSGYTIGSNIGSNGSDGMCYPCVKRECPKGSSTDTTKCSGEAYLVTTGYSGSKACKKCACPDNYEENGHGGCRCTQYEEYDYGCGGPKLKVCKGTRVNSDFGRSCTSPSQCIDGCAPCSILIGASRQGSTCR